MQTTNMETGVKAMSGIISVYTSINRLLPCLESKMPKLHFQEVVPGSSDVLKQLQSTKILIADYNLLAPAMYELPNLTWVQGTWAGADVLLKHYDSTKKLPYTITRFSGGFFGSMMSEYVVAVIVNNERNMEAMMKNRRDGVWLKDSQFQLKICDHRGIRDLTVGILGLGSIGKEIAKVLKTLGATVWGLVRTLSSEKEKPDYVDRCFTLHDGCDATKELPELLRRCDYVINVLPETSQTVGLLNGDVLKHCEGRKTVFVNIGRGSVIRESDLVHALEQKWLQGAILDVFEEEPLPPTSVLWKMPQVMITPHIAGVTKAEYMVEVFKENYERFVAGQPLNYVLDLDKGY